jgi:hypothetical protein
MAIIAGSATGSITELLGTELLALLSFSEHSLCAGGLCLSLADPACSAAQSRLSTQIAIIAGSATGSVTELLGTELLALLSFSEH